MRLRGLTNVLVIAGIGLAGVTAIALYACTPDEHRQSAPPTGACDPTAGKCCADPGQFPPPDCSTSAASGP